MGDEALDDLNVFAVLAGMVWDKRARLARLWRLRRKAPTLKCLKYSQHIKQASDSAASVEFQARKPEAEILCTIFGIVKVTLVTICAQDGEQTGEDGEYRGLHIHPYLLIFLPAKFGMIRISNPC